MPVTSPDTLTVAIDGLPVAQTPAGVALLNRVVALGHILSNPLVDATTGTAFTVTALVATAVPQEFVTV